MIHLYRNATLSQRDGYLLGGDSVLAIGPLDAAVGAESDPVKLAVRCDLGYQAMGYTYIELIGDTKSYWALAPDSGGNPDTWCPYGGRLVITDQVTDVNYIFWAKAKSTSDEVSHFDYDTQIVVKAILGLEE